MSLLVHWWDDAITIKIFCQRYWAKHVWNRKYLIVNFTVDLANIKDIIMGTWGGSLLSKITLIHRPAQGLLWFVSWREHLNNWGPPVMPKRMPIIILLLLQVIPEFIRPMASKRDQSQFLSTTTRCDWDYSLRLAISYFDAISQPSSPAIDPVHVEYQFN